MTSANKYVDVLLAVTWTPLNLRVVTLEGAFKLCVCVCLHCIFTRFSFMGRQIVGRGLFCCRVVGHQVGSRQAHRQQAVATCKPYQTRSEQKAVLFPSDRHLLHSWFSRVRVFHLRCRDAPKKVLVCFLSGVKLDIRNADKRINI